MKIASPLVFRGFIVWLVCAMALLIPLLPDVGTLVTVYALSDDALIWFVAACGTTLLFCIAIGWQRRNVPIQIIAATILLFIMWVIVPLSTESTLVRLKGSEGGLLWWAWCWTVIQVAFVWVGWRWRKAHDWAKRRNRIVELAQSQLVEGIALLDKHLVTIWVNTPASDYMARLGGDIRRLMTRANESKRLQAQTFALGEGERVSVQVVPQTDGTIYLLMKPLQNYADATQFYEHFIRRLVHDMRNPLAAIIAHASNLHTAQLTDGNSYQRTAETIEHEAQRLTRLVDSMLFDARLSYVPLATQSLDLRDIVEDVLFQHDERAVRDGKRIEVEMPPRPAPFEGDRDLLTRALSNLVDNSLKYASGSASVQIILEDTPTNYWIRVVDTGHGIPAEMLPDRIFEALVRGKVGQGSGLGLAIVKKIIEMHSGTIRAESIVGQGTKMIIWLPK